MNPQNSQRKQVVENCNPVSEKKKKEKKQRRALSAIFFLVPSVVCFLCLRFWDSDDGGFVLSEVDRASTRSQVHQSGVGPVHTRFQMLKNKRYLLLSLSIITSIFMQIYASSFNPQGNKKLEQ